MTVVYCREKQKEKQREELWKKLHQLEERHGGSVSASSAKKAR